eukprot:4876405-Pleurochrysis_carterae.AAC.1
MNPCRSEAGVSLAGTTPSRAASADAFAACGELGTALRDASASASPSEFRSSRITGSVSALTKLAHFSSGHQFRPYDVAFIIVNKCTAIFFAS